MPAGIGGMPLGAASAATTAMTFGTPMGWVSGGLALAGSLLGMMGDDDEAEAAAEQYGIKVAASKFTTEAALKNASKEVQVLNENAAKAKFEADAAQAAAEGQVKVNAAAAGVSGDSVEGTIRDTSVNADRVSARIEQDRLQGKMQLNQDAIDFGVTGAINRGTLQTKSRSDVNTAVTGVASFIQGYRLAV